MTSSRTFRRLAAVATLSMLAAGAARAAGESPVPAAGAVPTPRAIAAAPAETGASAKVQAIFAVTDADPAKWNLTLANIANAIDGLGADSADIELVAYGPGIAMLKKDSPVAGRIAEALKSGVRIAACQNSMRAFHLEPADLAAGASPVPSGVVELIRRQRAGYAYVRS